MIRKQRIKLRITQKQLANVIGVSQAYISKIENEEFVNVTIKEVARLAKALRLKELEVAKYFLDKYNNINIECGEEIA